MAPSGDLTGKYPAKYHVERTFETLFGSLSAELKSKPQAIFLAGGTTPYRNDTDRELPFRQESNFFYLTGCTVPGSFFLAVSDPTSTSLRTTLYIFEPTIVDLLWSPAPPTLEEARGMYDVNEVLHPTSLADALGSLQPGTIVHVLPQTGQFPSVFISEVGEAAKGIPTIDAHLLNALHKTRLIKDDYEIAMIRKANDISSRAHEVVMRVLGMAVQGKIKKSGGPAVPGEWLIEKEAEAEAIFVASCRREGAIHQAYLPIVAASTRASTLHYCCNDRAFAWGPVNPRDAANIGTFAHDHGHAHEEDEKQLSPQVLLIDAGCEWDCYSADITRTMPVGNNGKFTKEAKEIYNLVLKMQTESFKIVRPGTHWDDVQLLCHRVLVEGFLDLGIFKDPSPTVQAANGHATTQSTPKPRDHLVQEILRTGLSAAFFPHGVGHSLGMDVHDVPSASRPLGSGIYFADAGVDAGGKGGHKDFYKNLRLRLKLEAGMVVTIEPGAYFHPALLTSYEIHSSPHIDPAVLAKYEGMGGVRIEDDVLITEVDEGVTTEERTEGNGGRWNGCENLTTVRSEVGWVERICAGEE
ncbi:hypothetical protein HYDPIDRAFT_165961 [Hydnomerulius pinastri MD-312]|nr:hypothetical protein HYDPIDRAFT_165961 [Hydnomerulius pinastri MD-312]